MSGVFPSCSSLLYRALEEAAALPRAELPPFLLGRLSEQESRAVPDAREVAALGHLARKLEIEAIEAELTRWLAMHATANGHDAVARFLSAYWLTRSTVSTPLVNALIYAIGAYSSDFGTRDSAVLALGVAYDIIRLQDPILAARIRNALRTLWPWRAQLQGNVHAALARVRAV